jgi:3-hydroxyacyl-[acyl-carrier-protein] dehydratase
MTAAPFLARWQTGPMSQGRFEAVWVLGDESLFSGHYPGAPILPGLYLVEGLAQAAVVASGGAVVLKEIVRCRFHSPLLPGERVATRFELTDAGAGTTRVVAEASGRAQVADVVMLLAPSVAGVELEASSPPPEQVAVVGRHLDAAFVCRALPHRPPMLLIDDATIFEVPGERLSLVARWHTVRGTSWAAQGRRYPPILIAESFGQACGVLRAGARPASELCEADELPVVGKLVGVRFIGDVDLGETLEHHVRLLARTGEGAVFSGQTLVKGRVVLEVDRIVAARSSLPRGP